MCKIHFFFFFLSLFEAQLEKGNFSHFQCFKEFRTRFKEDVNLEFQTKFMHDLHMHVWRDFQISTELRVAFFCPRIPLIVTLMTVELQLELIDFKENDLLKENIC